MPLSVYIWFQGPHLKLPLNPTDEVLFFDGASNLVAKISGEILLRQLAHAMNALALETMMRDEVTPAKPLQPLPPRRLTAEVDEAPATPNEKERAELRKLRRSRRRGLKVLAALAGCVLLAIFNEVGWADTLTELLWEDAGWIEHWQCTF